MHEPADTSEIWFERIGLTLGWFGTYSPITMKGVYVLLMHMLPLLVVWVLPLSLLGHFGVVPGLVVFALVVPAAIACVVSVMRIAHRHSLPPA